MAFTDLHEELERMFGSSSSVFDARTGHDSEAGPGWHVTGTSVELDRAAYHRTKLLDPGTHELRRRLEYKRAYMLIWKARPGNLQRKKLNDENYRRRLGKKPRPEGWGTKPKSEPTPRPPVRTGCTVEGCERKHVAKGFCQTHFSAAFDTPERKAARAAATAAWKARQREIRASFRA